MQQLLGRKKEKQLEQGSRLEFKAPLIEIQKKSVVAVASFKAVSLISEFASLKHARLPYRSSSLSHLFSTHFSILWFNIHLLSRGLSLQHRFLLVNLVVGVFTTTSISSWHHGSRPTVCRISRGDAGIEEVTQSLCDVDVAAARAFDPRDEQKVKTTIQTTVP